MNKHKNYTKKKGNISRLDYNKFKKILEEKLVGKDCIIIMERPMVNFRRFKASLSAVRCLEAELIALEACNLPFRYCDSKNWQRFLLPFSTPTVQLKVASLKKGKELFPDTPFKDDADSALMAYWASKVDDVDKYLTDEEDKED